MSAASDVGRDRNRRAWRLPNLDPSRAGELDPAELSKQPNRRAIRQRREEVGDPQDPLIGAVLGDDLQAQELQQLALPLATSVDVGEHGGDEQMEPRRPA